MIMHKLVSYFILHTGKLNLKNPAIEKIDLDRSEADSILKSWCIKRELPPEDFDWLYRDEQLEKANQKEKRK
jgi:hypothetical protein